MHKFITSCIPTDAVNSQNGYAIGLATIQIHQRNYSACHDRGLFCRSILNWHTTQVLSIWNGLGLYHWYELFTESDSALKIDYDIVKTPVMSQFAVINVWSYTGGVLHDVNFIKFQQRSTRFTENQGPAQRNGFHYPVYTGWTRICGHHDFLNYHVSAMNSESAYVLKLKMARIGKYLKSKMAARFRAKP